jgi:hypothetical protein
VVSARRPLEIEDLASLYHLRFLDENPLLVASLQKVVMAAAAVAKASRDPHSRGFFSSETKLEKAIRQLKEAMLVASSRAQQAYGVSNLESAKLLKLSIDAFRVRYPNWPDAYAVIDHILS